MDNPKKLRVLVVDDEERFARNMAKVLNARGFEAQAVFDGASALSAAEGARLDAVLLDMRMPDMDGLTVLRRLKSRDPSPEVIMLTGHATVESGVEAIREGAFDYLLKPCDVEALVEKLRLVGEVGRIRRRPVLWVRTIAEDITLSDFQRLYVDDDVARVVAIFNLNRIRMAAETLFVVDRDDRLQGYLTAADLVALARDAGGGPDLTWDTLREHPERLPRRAVGDVMTQGGPFAVLQMPLKEMAQLMMRHGLRSLPVVEDERVVGVVRLRDALNHLQDADAAQEA